MNLDGFHYTRSKNDVGYKVPGGKLESAQALVPAKSTANWKLSESVPHSGNSDQRLWFTYAELCHLMMQSEDDVRAMARENRWRSRRHNTTKIRAFYLYDLLVTVWGYMTEWEGNTLDPVLLEEAINRVE
jgi:hypothetical protein